MSNHRKITPPERDTSAADAGGSSGAPESPASASPDSTPINTGEAGETPDAAAPEASASPPFNPALSLALDLTATKRRVVRYTTHGTTYDLFLSDNGDLLRLDTEDVAVTGAKQWTEGDPVEGCWVPLN